MPRVLIALLFLLSASSSAQDGQIDLSYGSAGFVEGLAEAHPIRLSALAVGPDDAAVYVGWSGRGETEAFVGRVTPEGHSDAPFGADGRVVLDVEGTSETLRAVAVRADGHLVATGQASPDGAPSSRVLTLQLDGAGRVVAQSLIDLGEAARGEGVALSARGAYIAVSLLDSQTCGVLRLDVNGALDATFGTDGLVVLPVGSPCEVADLVRTESGVAVLGTLDQDTGVVFVAQLTPDGRLDAAFGEDGVATRSFDSSRNKASSLAVGPGGDLIVGGLSQKGSAVGPLLVRFKASGEPVASFGYEGLYWSADAPEDGRYAEPPGVAVLSDGRVVFATTTSPTLRLTVGGVTPTGERDRSFGTDGFTTATEQVSPYSYGRAIAVDSQGRLIAGGEAIVEGTRHRLVLSRLTSSAAVSSSDAAPVETGVRMRIAPNPTVSRARVRTVLDQPADVHASVIDSLGREVARLHDGAAPSGELALEWDASGAAPGLYVVRLLVDGRPSVQTLTVAR